MNTPDPQVQGTPFCREMTVAHIRERKGAEYVQVVFLESARFYKLPKAHPSFDKILGLVREAMAIGRVLTVRLASPDSDVIENAHVAVQEAP